MPVKSNNAENKKLLTMLENENIQFMCYASGELELMNTLFKMLTPILSGASLVMFLFVMVLIFNFISASVADKKHEIGVLRAMGARGKDTAKIFILEGAVIFAVTLFVSIVFAIIGVNVLNAALIQELTATLSILSFNFLTVLYCIAAIGITIFLACIIPLYKIIKLKPIDAIKVR